MFERGFSREWNGAKALLQLNPDSLPDYHLAVEARATDRAYRLGQNKNVMVHRYLTQNTFEERIDEMILQRKYLSEMTVASGENWLGKLSNKELWDIYNC